MDELARRRVNALRMTVEYGVTCPDLRHAFPRAEEMVVNGLETLGDRDHQPGCGYVSLDEAAILYELSRRFAGVWCEIGSHTGWSGAHIAAAGSTLVAIEPQFVYLPFFQRARANWRRAGVDERIYPVATRSPFYFEGCVESFVGAFIDGDHEAGKPLEDARLVLPKLAPHAVVCLHDFVGQPVREAVTWLVREQGFRFRVYDTMGMLAVCWRGDDAFRPPSHRSDDRIDWQAQRAQYTDFDWRGER